MIWSTVLVARATSRRSRRRRTAPGPAAAATAARRSPPRTPDRSRGSAGTPGWSRPSGAPRPARRARGASSRRHPRLQTHPATVSRHSSLPLVPTHAVTNQVPPRCPRLRHDVAGRHSSGASARRACGAGPATRHTRTVAVPRRARAGSAEAQRVGRAGQRPTSPVLRTHSPTGERIDEVEFHPAWHPLMDVAVGARPHRRARGPSRSGSGAHVRRAAGFIAWSQVEAGHLCPVSMTYAAAPALAANPELAAALAAPARLARATTSGCARSPTSAAPSPAWA